MKLNERNPDQHKKSFPFHQFLHLDKAFCISIRVPFCWEQAIKLILWVKRTFVIASTPNNRAIHDCYLMNLDSENSFFVTLITRHRPFKYQSHHLFSCIGILGFMEYYAQGNLAKRLETKPTLTLIICTFFVDLIIVPKYVCT